jgi:Rrf2 family protein
MESLMDAGLVAVERGRRGGFVLNKPRSQVTLLDVYQAIEGPLIPKNCLLSRRVCKDGRCILGPLINSVNRQVAAQLARTRLCDLVPATANRRKRAP